MPSFLPASLEEELLGPEDGRRLCIRFQQSPGGAGCTLPAHTLDDEECHEFLRWRRDHEVMEEAQGAGCEMETEYLRQCVHGLCVSLLEPAQVHCHRPPMPLGRRPQLGALVDEAVCQMAAWHRDVAPDAAPLRWPRHTRHLWHIP